MNRCVRQIQLQAEAVAMMARTRPVTRGGLPPGVKPFYGPAYVNYCLECSEFEVYYPKDK